LDEKLWHSASVDSQALLELLRATPSDPSDPSDPAALWRRCARRLDVAEESELDAVGDELLSQWLKQNEEGTSEAGSSSLFPSSGISAPRRGDLLLTGAHAFAAGTQQFLHKAILIVLAVDGDEDSSEDTVHFGGDEDFDRWTCLSPGESHHDATPLGDSGLWWVRDAAEAWRTRRLSPCNMLFARGAVRLGSLELELWQRRGEMGLVRHWSPKLRDVLSACCSYEGPGARGVRLGLYGDHHGFGLWEVTGRLVLAGEVDPQLLRSVSPFMKVMIRQLQLSAELWVTGPFDTGPGVKLWGLHCFAGTKMPRLDRRIPKTNYEDEFPEDELPPEDELRRRIPRRREDELRRRIPRRRIAKTNSNSPNCPPKTNSHPKTDSEDEFPEDELPPEDEFPPEDELRRRIPRRRIAPRRRIPTRRRIPKTNSPKTNCPPKTNSPPKTNCEDEFPEDELPPEDEFPPEDELRRRIPRRRIAPRRRLFHQGWFFCVRVESIRPGTWQEPVEFREKCWASAMKTEKK
ncbi:unnamed protein product, partial [Cladocopium goreaui]